MSSSNPYNSQERDVGPVERLILELGRLPGIGERSAARLAFYLLKQARDAGVEASLAFDLSKALVEVVQEVGLCKRCFNLCTGDICSICKFQIHHQSYESITDKFLH